MFNKDTLKKLADLADSLDERGHSEEANTVDEIITEAGKIRGIPDGTGPYGKGAGPGQGRADGTGLEKIPGVPNGTGPFGQGAGPGQGQADGIELEVPIVTVRPRGVGRNRMPNGTGPYGRGAGPGQGRADGTGLGQ